MSTFARAMELSTVPVSPVSIPYEGSELPAYLVPATGRETEVLPLLILNNGYDGTIEGSCISPLGWPRQNAETTY